MSTVDSYINSSATLIVHDFLKPMKLVKNELMVVRIVSLIVGVFAIMLSLLESNLLDLILFTYSFYAPIVSIPFGMAVLGFRSSTKSVLISMLSGFTIVVIWNVFNIQLANSVVVGMLANLIALLSSHYLLKQPGGWVGIKDKAPLMALREERRQSKLKLFKEIKNFNLLKILKSNCPAGDGMISLIGFFVMISTFTSTHTLPRDIQLEYKNILDIYYPIALFYVDSTN
jgi:Na+/proline symporter